MFYLYSGHTLGSTRMRNCNGIFFAASSSVPASCRHRLCIEDKFPIISCVSWDWPDWGGLRHGRFTAGLVGMQILDIEV